NGTVAFLETRPAGTDSAGNLVFEADSPEGLSGFALLALGEREATMNTTDTAAPSTETPPEATAPQQAPLSTLAIVSGVLIGCTAYVIRKRDD
ncbi:MAG: hypothetical protein PHP59_11290, partial [Methanofollis sp.]|uniref:hypothetical protein n=1 Tax=Methanofollis sp. TaxID=2052835 RepID=UPI002603C155